MRTIIVGPPRSGKSTLARQLGGMLVPIFCGDPITTVKQRIAGVYYLPENLPFAGDGGSSDWIARNWFTMPGPWVMEGHVMARALRRWADSHPAPLRYPCDKIILLDKPHPEAVVTRGQEIMGKGVMTVWQKIEYIYLPIVDVMPSHE